MALVTVQRGSDQPSEVLPEEIEETEDIGELISIASPSKKTKKKLLRQGSVSENFFAVKGAALILPRQSSLDHSMDAMQVKKFGGDLKNHLYAIFNHIRPQDNIKLAARLECWTETRMRYMVIVATVGRQDTEESIIMGVDFPSRESTECTIGLVIPIWSDTTIRLDGDGGFEVAGRDKVHTFKPVSVQAMWSALQAVHKCVGIAQKHNYYYGSLYLTWTCYYESRISSPRICLNEWEYREEIWSRRANFFEEKEAQREITERKIREKLKQVMMKIDLDNCNSRDIRELLEKVIDADLNKYKAYIDSEMLVILRQMDTSSKILDYLYLGSEWNASNLEEMKQIGITHVLNITAEIDNFYPDDFSYKNVRYHDYETTDLLHVWNDTYKFIKRAQRLNGKCLVHCKMGISRSAASVSAYLMKENLWSMEKALSFVKERRPIIQPNKGFMRQLQEYEGILNASAQRHNQLFRSLSESNLSVDFTPKNESEAGGASPSLSTPVSGVFEPTFDLNRHLLDLTVLPYRSGNKRPKSWSPEEAKHYYLDVDDFMLSGSEKATVLEKSHVSDPSRFFTPIQSSQSEINSASSTYPHDKRKKWKRRHTEHLFLDHTFDLDSNARSDDSVFANPGVVPPPRVDPWMKLGEASDAQLKVRAERRSSPAAIRTNDNLLEVENKESETHSSLVSPMNSPSLKSARNVNVSTLKSRFDDDPDVQAGQENRPGPTPKESLNTVKAVVAEIESPMDEKPSETNTELLSAVRERSFSENHMFSVKSLVNEIESRYSTDHPGSSDILPGKENSDAPQNVGISRSQSLPARSKKQAMSPPLLPVIEDKPVESSSSPLKCLDKNINTNNNNIAGIVPEYKTMTVIEVDKDAAADPSLIKTVCHQGCSITENLHPSPKPTSSSRDDTPHADEKKKYFVRTLTQSELQVIREVGKTFLSESDETNSVVSSDTSSCSGTNVLAADSDDVPCIKRGIVRRMARLIENKMEQQLGTENTGRHWPSEASTAGTPPTATPTTVINKLLMGEVLQTEKKDVKIKPRLPKQDCGPKLEPTAQKDTDLKAGARITTAASTDSLKDLISLVGPTPYSPVHTSLASTANDFIDRWSVGYSKVFSKTPAKAIRRTQSERSTYRPIRRTQSELSMAHPGKMFFLGSKQTKQTEASKSHPDVSTDSSQETPRSSVLLQNPDSPVDSFSFSGVKEIVRNIENAPKQVSEEWPGGDRLPRSTDVRAPENRSGRIARSNSNPHVFQSDLHHRQRFKARASKTRMRRKSDAQIRLRNINPFYQTM